MKCPCSNQECKVLIPERTFEYNAHNEQLKYYTVQPVQNELHGAPCRCFVSIIGPANETWNKELANGMLMQMNSLLVVYAIRSRVPSKKWRRVPSGCLSSFDAKVVVNYHTSFGHELLCFPKDEGLSYNTMFLCFNLELVDVGSFDFSREFGGLSVTSEL